MLFRDLSHKNAWLHHTIPLLRKLDLTFQDFTEPHDRPRRAFLYNRTMSQLNLLFQITLFCLGARFVDFKFVFVDRFVVMTSLWARSLSCWQSKALVKGADTQLQWKIMAVFRKKDGAPTAKFYESSETIELFEPVKKWLNKNTKTYPQVGRMSQVFFDQRLYPRPQCGCETTSTIGTAL